MYNYTIHFLREDGTKGDAYFSEPTETEARKSFRECYRHGHYEIISIDCVVVGQTVAEQVENIANAPNVNQAQKEALLYAAKAIRFLESKSAQ